MNYQLPKTSPWGTIDLAQIIMEGQLEDGKTYPLIWRVSTASHGGIHLHPELAAKLHAYRLHPGTYKFGGSTAWFEEDLEAAAPLYIFYNSLKESAKPKNREELLKMFTKYGMQEVTESLMHIGKMADIAAGMHPEYGTKQ